MNLKIKLIFTFLILVHSINAQNVFKIKITISKETYIIGEPIQIGISIINISNSVVKDDYLGSLILKLKDKNINDVQRSGISNNDWGPLKNTLSPNEEDYRVFTLNDYWGKPSPGMLVGFQYLEPGYYTVKAIFLPKNQLYNKDSTQTSFQVVEAEGKELIVYNKLLDILKQESKNKVTKQNEEKTVKDLRYLYEENPNSVYSAYILEMLDALYEIPLGDSEKAYWARKEMVEKYSWLEKASYMLKDVLSRMKSYSDKIEYLKKLRTKNKNTLMEKIYEKKIKEIEKN